MTIFVAVSREMIAVDNLIDMIDDSGHGAIDCFIGKVRNLHEGKVVRGISYDGHELLMSKTMSEICREAESKWPHTHYAISHYLGDLDVGEISIVIAVSSAHRAESFDACRFVIEAIKKRLPVWKQEHYEDGKSEWLPGHSLRSAAAPCCGQCGGRHHG